MRAALAGGVYAALSATDALVAASPTPHRRVRRVTKAALMPTLAARALATGRPGAGRAVTAQALSWGGDLALLGSSRRAFAAGLGSFLAAHLAYVSALRRRGEQPLLATAGRRGLLGAGALLAAGMGAAAHRDDPRLALPVTAYGTALAALVASAAAVDADRGRAQALTGAWLFLLSDTLLGLREFVLDDSGPALEGAVMATYTAAQWWLAEGLLRG